jgi:SAM-dependent methyltransferase
MGSSEHDLLAPGIPRPGGVWADIGSDAGYFTLALFKIVGPGAEIYSVDKSPHALEKQRRMLAKLAPTARIRYVQADLTQPMALPPLDGMVMVNVLHEIKLERQEGVLRHLREYLKPDGGRLILVDREVRTASLRVPYPVTYESFEYLAGAAGFADVRRIAVLPVGLFREMYSALGLRAG